MNADKFWSLVTVGAPDECWPWSGRPNGSGYGMVRLHGKTMSAHVAAYVLTNGPMAKGLYGCHSCDNPLCCNPAHIFAGTQKENMQDCAAKGRNGSQLHPESRPRGDAHWTRARPELLARGERANAGKGKLTASQVQEIREAYRSGHSSQSALGNRYGVSQTQIGRIVRGVRWAWLAEEDAAALPFKTLQLAESGDARP